ncbi:PLP-dependent transferase [Obba rivulosa]|uniref:PLP-dependent transferase n=1 Tax=Obba rivulosa TaxID=1052685 RepID=A0A8E2J782_9APHY|nr:PLP-dependent transferase [Obba rivulosa]
MPNDRVYASCLNDDLHKAVGAWFLGPQSENLDLLKKLFADAADTQAAARRDYHPEDGAFITTAMQESSVFQQMVDKLQTEYWNVARLLNDYSIPFWSPRYAGHMTFDTSLPAILGSIATTLFNPNNVAFEASPITTLLEIDVGNDLCEMLGYREQGNVQPWGHIACDGTVANLESIWAARNLKYYPLSLRDAMEPGNELNFIADTFKVHKCAEPEILTLLRDLDTWELLNLRVQEILDIPTRLYDEYGITSTFLESIMTKYIIQSRGKQAVEQEWNIKMPPQYLISNTKHYSWPKGAAIAGLGSDNMVDVPVDNNARVNIDELRNQLQKHLDDKQAVFAVVAIIGSTEEGAVDPLDEVLKARDDFQAQGLSFVVHADAAWGGYFASMIRDKPTLPGGPILVPTPRMPEPDREFVPTVTLRDSTVRQFHALAQTDSITIDPHKAGYVPYPAGGLCYRDGRMRFLLTWSAPYIKQAEDGESIGIYGVEGSKPGAPAVGTYLHHRVVGLHKEGHGGLLGEVSFTCRRISAHWAAMSTAADDFIVVPFNPLKSEPDGPDAVEKEKEFIRTNILGHSNEEIVRNQALMDELCTLGSDLNINAFACNFKINGKTNTDVEEANYLNNLVFQRLSVTTTKEKPADTPLFLSATTFAMKDYKDCATNYKKRIGLETESDQDLFILRNVVMSPFQSAGDFVQKIADIFQNTLEEEMKHVVARNTITPRKHSFTMQGTDKLYLVYRSQFYNANGRFQVILGVDANTDAFSKYQAARKNNPKEVYVLSTQDVNVSDICQDGGSFVATVSGKDLDLTSVQISNVRVIKNRPLDSRWRDPTYPADFTPFYLYGTAVQPHIAHMLLKAPNAQMSADQVALSLDAQLTDAQLAGGLLLRVSWPEAAIQPSAGSLDTYVQSLQFFHEGAKLGVEVYADPNAAAAHGPGLAAVMDDGAVKPIAKGTATLASGLYVEYTELNRQDFTNLATHRVTSVTSRQAHPKTRKEWRDVVDKRLGPRATRF